MGHTTSSLGPYRDELVRRESARVASESAKAAHELVELTRTIRVLTIVLAVTGIVRDRRRARLEVVPAPFQSVRRAT